MTTRPPGVHLVDGRLGEADATCAFIRAQSLKGAALRATRELTSIERQLAQDTQPADQPELPLGPPPWKRRRRPLGRAKRASLTAYAEELRRRIEQLQQEAAKL